MGAVLALFLLLPPPGAAAGDSPGGPEFSGRVWKIPPNLKQRMQGPRGTRAARSRSRTFDC
jgi:hypothetical protein